MAFHIGCMIARLVCRYDVYAGQFWRSAYHRHNRCALAQSSCRDYRYWRMPHHNRACRLQSSRSYPCCSPPCRPAIWVRLHGGFRRLEISLATQWSILHDELPSTFLCEYHHLHFIVAAFPIFLFVKILAHFFVHNLIIILITFTQKVTNAALAA